LGALKWNKIEKKGIYMEEKDFTKEKTVFNEQIEKYELYIRVHGRRFTLLSNVRLVLMIVTIAAIYLTIELNLEMYYWLFVGVLALGFIQIVKQHRKLKYGLAYAKEIIEINKEYLCRLEGKWHSFKEMGEEFIQEEHPYATDLDIIGENSLFQMICTAHTWHGKKELAQMLLNFSLQKNEILEKQKAIKELGNSLEFVQKIEYLTKNNRALEKKPTALLAYAQEVQRPFTFSKRLLLIGPIITCSSLLLAFFLKSTPFYVIGGVGAFIQLLMSLYLRVGVEEQLQGMKALEYKLNTYEKVIEALHIQTFHSDYLNKVQQKVTKVEDETLGDQAGALQGMKALTKISNRAHLTLQPLLAIPLNALFLWDLDAAFNMQIWRKHYGKHIEKWLEGIGEFEALMSLSVLTHFKGQIIEPHFNESENEGIILAKELGHPLIHKSSRVNNSFELKNSLWIITGSNMSGKTTFLRTIGINMVLAYCGAPVFAESLEIGRMKIYTCMRIQDDLKEGKSTFYAELLRIKAILEAGKNAEPMLFLIDEIFRGTNSIDRIEGAKSVVKGLNKEHIVGAITTHDLELCMLEHEKRVVNYHFSEHYNENEILFDYTLKEGPSTSTNAKYLMKMVGIEI
jgi:DNA mismatch repair ATPase MutS